jgi:1-deoxy-D-xylulose-5-phosphate reductoisomerase
LEKRRYISVLGSTGSIGTQALEVVRDQPDYFGVSVLTAGRNANLLIQQAIEFQPDTVVIEDESQYLTVKEALMPYAIKVFAGADAIEQVAGMEEPDIVLTALVGFSGLKPTLSAIKAGKPIALANKETLVVAGALVTETAKEKGVNLYPVDSEHSAIFQCLAGEFHNPIEKIILTASGGPFRGKNLEELATVTRAQALKHPNWTMGAKITIDSSTLMNKGLEVIEAKWLFALAPEQIDVIVHPQSIIHSIVQFQDGSMKAQMGLPDMKLPIQYALTYPNRLSNTFPRFDFLQYPNLSFEAPDYQAFPCLNLAFEALRVGGNTPCVLNAANEVAVAAFLNDKITFLQIPAILETAIQKMPFIAEPSLHDLLASDAECRSFVSQYINSPKATA